MAHVRVPCTSWAEALLQLASLKWLPLVLNRMWHLNFYPRVTRRDTVFSGAEPNDSVDMSSWESSAVIPGG
ncbi:hypothetical protein CBR_g37629 [Chara braunii]|uniref:Uncharacterized protein n=1 Tax=Chara braunii TaxID=69332 RepID=A0A388LNI5_CHABU|nr:hypothetical protein CBR_g37629 [Chara braunii]|eukprot:GBG83829.1 hypothetical protein CBR_g37629 [Chara braunii]